MEQIIVFILSLAIVSCNSSSPYSNKYTIDQFSILKKKIEINEAFSSKDFNIIFKTLRHKKSLMSIGQKEIAKAIIFSKQKNLVRAYMEAFCKFKHSNLKKGLSILYKDNPNLLKRYLDYFSTEDQKELATIIF